jgi:AcrR family transcriptional regulator
MTDLTVSGRNRQSVRKPTRRDRRSARTHDDLLAAFRDLILSLGYDGVTVSNIVDRANVGRSTFYEHSENKDDLFRQSAQRIVGILADTVCEEYERASLEAVVQHFREGRGVLATVNNGTARTVLTRYLAAELETRLALHRRRATRKPALPLSLVAAAIAEAQCGLIVAWLCRPDVTVQHAADALAASSRAIASVNAGK